jgi:hypothetical protein
MKYFKFFVVFLIIYSIFFFLAIKTPTSNSPNNLNNSSINLCYSCVHNNTIPQIKNDTINKQSNSTKTTKTSQLISYTTMSPKKEFQKIKIKKIKKFFRQSNPPKHLITKIPIIHHPAKRIKENIVEDITPLDIVYTWVNGSDPKFIQSLCKYKNISLSGFPFFSSSCLCFFIVQKKRNNRKIY